MKTGFAVLAGVGVLSLAVGGGGANAATRHYQHRHAAKSHVMSAPSARAEYTDLATNGNNPAKKFPTRHMPDRAIKTSTLPTSGNNLAKAYAARHMPENAIHEATLPTNGNNPAKRYKSATTGSASR